MVVVSGNAFLEKKCVCLTELARAELCLLAPQPCGGNHLPAIKEPNEELHMPVNLATPVCLSTNGRTTGQPRLDISDVRPMAYLQSLGV